MHKFDTQRNVDEDICQNLSSTTQSIAEKLHEETLLVNDVIIEEESWPTPI